MEAEETMSSEVLEKIRELTEKNCDQRKLSKFETQILYVNKEQDDKLKLQASKLKSCTSG